MKSKAELLEITGDELPKFLKEAKKRDPKFLMPKLKEMDFPEVSDLKIKMEEADDPDDIILTVIITVKYKNAKNKIHEITYNGACFSHPEHEQYCIFENIKEDMDLFLKYFTEYHIYNTISRYGIAPNEWNDWNKIKKQY